MPKYFITDRQELQAKSRCLDHQRKRNFPAVRFLLSYFIVYTQLKEYNVYNIRHFKDVLQNGGER